MNKDFIHSNIKDLTPNEVSEIIRPDGDLDFCRKCGIIDKDNLLYFTNGEDFWEVKELNIARRISKAVLCHKCLRYYLIPEGIK